MAIAKLNPDTKISGIDNETIKASPSDDVPKTEAINSSLTNPKPRANIVAKTAIPTPFKVASLLLFFILKTASYCFSNILFSLSSVLFDKADNRIKANHKNVLRVALKLKTPIRIPKIIP